ncbi:MAG: mechanosensitive ion channel family protein [Propionibacteriaceae bacterium]|jgi:small conductance mechanosensitive channel|nr:mechanosensitive ion channel family protein [Propionibacteriaceae bacterium]
MWPLDLSWTWPRSLIVIASALGVAVLGYVIGTWLIRCGVRHLERRAAAAAAGAGRLSETGTNLLAGTSGPFAGSPPAAAPDGSPAPLFPDRTIRRVRVIASLGRSIWIALLALFVVLAIFWAVGVSVAPVLASAGVASVIVGLGAQSLIKDLLAGLFLIGEDQYGIGDLISVGTLTGRVERVSFRVTQLRDGNGMVWFIRNGEILTVGNISQGHSTALADLPIAYGADIDHATAVLQKAAARAAKDPLVAPLLLEPPNLLGVESVSPTAVNFRIAAKTAPNQQWAVQRALLAYGLAALGEAGFPPPITEPAVRG